MLESSAEMAEFYETTRGKAKLSYLGYRYTVDKLRESRGYWRCEDRDCKGRAVTLDKEVIKTSEHMHGLSGHTTKAQKSKMELRKEASSSMAPNIVMGFK